MRRNVTNMRFSVVGQEITRSRLGINLRTKTKQRHPNALGPLRSTSSTVSGNRPVTTPSRTPCRGVWACVARWSGPSRLRSR